MLQRQPELWWQYHLWVVAIELKAPLDVKQALLKGFFDGFLKLTLCHGGPLEEDHALSCLDGLQALVDEKIFTDDGQERWTDEEQIKQYRYISRGYSTGVIACKRMDVNSIVNQLSVTEGMSCVLYAEGVLYASLRDDDIYGGNHKFVSISCHNIDMFESVIFEKEMIQINSKPYPYVTSNNTNTRIWLPEDPFDIAGSCPTDMTVILFNCTESILPSKDEPKMEALETKLLKAVLRGRSVS
jgi:hypothetical protein